jgi:magnesium-transporting ATPase (P-type)
VQSWPFVCVHVSCVLHVHLVCSRNLAFLGTLLTEGAVTGLVVATGAETMMGEWLQGWGR